MIRSDNPPDNGVSGAMYLFGTAFLWSFIGILVRANSQSALLIGAVTAIFMALFILLVGRPVLRVSRLIVLVAVCNFVTGTTFNFANQLTTVGNAIVLQYTSMIFVIVYQSLATRTLPSPAKIASVLVAFTGMGLFFLGDLSAEGMLGNLLAVISGATFGLCFFLNSRPDASPMVSSLISCGISILPIVYFAGDLGSVKPFEWGLMLVHGLFCSGLASVLYAKGIARTNAFAANLVCMSEVVLAPCWSALLFGEVFRWNEFLGAAIIVLVIVGNLAYDAFGDGFLVALVRHRNKSGLGVPGAAADDLDSGARGHQIPGTHYRLCTLWPDECRCAAAAGRSVFGRGPGRSSGAVWSLDNHCAGRNAVLCRTGEAAEMLDIHLILI